MRGTAARFLPEPEEIKKSLSKIKKRWRKGLENSFLAQPSKKYQKSFENYVLAYKNIKDDFYFNKYKKALENYQEYLVDLQNSSEGTNLPQGEVATSVYWLVDKDEVVGVVRIRHQEVDCAGHIGYDISPDFRNRGFGYQILKLALKKAKTIGIEDAVLTCNINNTASKKIIEKNRGILLGTVFDEEENEHLYKYRIPLHSL